MPVQTLSITGYRSIKHVYLPLQRVNVVVGPNGSGKTNLYRAMYILQQAAMGRLASTLAQEGGMPSLLWAGPRKDEPVRLKIAVRFEQLSYCLECGLPPPGLSAFVLDPEVKDERLYLHQGAKNIQMMGRANGSVWTRDDHGRREQFPPLQLSPSESILAELREPHRFPELSMLRQQIIGWRFYHQFRNDLTSPIRQPQVGVRTPVLSDDGHDLAAAIQTIREIGNDDAFNAALRDAFPDADILIPKGPRFSLSMRFPGFQRYFEAPNSPTAPFSTFAS
jgi:predicted ATPase